MSSKSASVRAVIDGREVIGSATTQKFESISINQWTKIFYISITLGQTLILQFAGYSGNESIDFTSAIAGETPISSSITIQRFV